MLPPNPLPQKLRQSGSAKRRVKLMLAIVIGFLLVFGGGYIKQIGLGSQPGFAQYLRPEFVADRVYLRLNYIPKENQYISKETGKVETDNTLISRIIRYHQDIMKRPTRFRIDWQLTLADYLGANEEIKQERYPGRSSLTANPMEADIKIINNLNRRQRQELVDVLVTIYDIDIQPEQPSTSESTPEPTPNPTPRANPTQPPTPTTPKKPPLSRPGDADLLNP